MMLAFLVAHLHLITTGHTVLSQLKAMITGWDDAPPKSVVHVSATTPSSVRPPL